MRIFAVWALSLGVGVFAQTPVVSLDTGAASANPGRPTVTNPATLPPVGYLQFEQGYLGSLTSPATAAQYGVNQVTKVAVHPRLMLQAQTQPYASSQDAGGGAFSGGFGDVLLGVQTVLFTPDLHAPSQDSPSKTPVEPRKTPVPTVSLGYLGRVHAGTTGDVDLGSYAHSLLLLLSGDVGGFHYDTNYIVNVQPGDVPDGSLAGSHGVKRAQFAQTLSVNHAVFDPNLQLSVELYHFSQPLVHESDSGAYVARADMTDLLIAPSYQVRPNLVVDGGFSRGFTSTSTRWQSFVGFTYLLPKRLWRGK
ncbi:MAG: transporter [Acidobacteriota bacterium]